ncbi:HAD family phosphatase [uncultured Roseovarius sp.]|uniref:HAD family hydrolase n=1 Tax=uncultured Roseovarius sp. TaxID=293344 RepID=UPI000C8E66BE|nr:haloacid dehalogenase [Roseovarius sp.]|tara:strand:- start:538 stop:1140 length:603 start_codon:yes stop_codon:yes gene_type:complete
MTLIVFDIGNVLLRWDPQAAFRHAIGSDAEIDALLAEVGFYDWNYEQDRGRSRAEAVAAIAARWPHHADLMDGYFDRFGLTIQNRIQGSWDIAAALKESGHRLWALTNFSADTWPQALQLHPQLTTLFEGIVVSGHERMVKPDREIFDLLCARAKAAPEACYFIDDSADNVTGARAAGWQAHHFTGPEALNADLRDRGLL